MKSYLGDGVYADIEHGMVKLTTEDGISTTNTIFLEPEVIEALQRYLRSIQVPIWSMDKPALRKEWNALIEENKEEWLRLRQRFWKAQLTHCTRVSKHWNRIWTNERATRTMRRLRLRRRRPILQSGRRRSILQRVLAISDRRGSITALGKAFGEDRGEGWRAKIHYHPTRWCASVRGKRLAHVSPTSWAYLTRKGGRKISDITKQNLGRGSSRAASGDWAAEEQSNQWGAKPMRTLILGKEQVSMMTPPDCDFVRDENTGITWKRSSSSNGLITLRDGLECHPDFVNGMDMAQFCWWINNQFLWTVKYLSSTGELMNLCPISLREANDFTESFHRHNGRTARNGGKFAIGLEEGEELMGVAIVGRPVARLLNDDYTAEVLRVCTRKDAPRNANSMLYAACWRAWRAMGGLRMVTPTHSKVKAVRVSKAQSLLW
jgi:hypothetical protein